MNQETSQVMTSKSQPLYFSVSKKKLGVMSICSLGIYELYWFYKNWEVIKERTGRDISPVVRTIFFPFFCYSLFKSVKESAHSHGIASETSPGWLAFAYITILVTYRLPNPVWLISFLSFLPLLHVQEVINQVNLKVADEFEPNDRFSCIDGLIIFLGLTVIIDILPLAA